MIKVYLLLHIIEKDDGERTYMTIGIYSSKEKSEAIREEYKKKEGFSSYPDCFYIYEYEVDKDNGISNFLSFIST